MLEALQGTSPQYRPQCWSPTAGHGDGRQAAGPRASEATAADVGRVGGTVAVAAAVTAPGQYKAEGQSIHKGQCFIAFNYPF